MRPTTREVHPEVRVRHHRVEQRRMSTKSAFVDGCPYVRVHSALEQPTRRVELLELHTNVEQRRSRDRRARQVVIVTARITTLKLQFRWKDLFVRERPAEE